MNVPIKLVKNVVTQEAGGNWGTPTETKYDLFAEILDAGHGFRTYDAQTQLGMVRRFKVRFIYTLVPTGDWKIEFRGKKWTIILIEPDQERSFYWIITANHK
jgi:hypothetical protein